MSLLSISPLDGRYQEQTAALAPYFSEYALIKYRVTVEVEWLLWLSRCGHIPLLRQISKDEASLLTELPTQFTEVAAERVKAIEAVTRHDVKAVEYYLREELAKTSLHDLGEWLHFGCTSEDINNLAYGMMIQQGLRQVWLPRAGELAEAVAALGANHAALPMLARTHGQAASPTTLGKELAVFGARWQRQLSQIAAQQYLGKFAGAVGNFNAHVAAFPAAPWPAICRGFVEHLGLTYNPLTTQIEPHDYMAECFHALLRFNNITLDFVRDMWSYISVGYFQQHAVAGEVGSSTMPHKVNPIDFENAEANLGLSNAMLDHLANKLPISRLQRDLSDSSALRNTGAAIAYGYLAIQSALRGLKKVSPAPDVMAHELDANWEVLGEAIQTVLRAHGQAGAYEKLKDLTRGAAVDQARLAEFIATLDLPAAEKDRLLKLTPASYTGLATKLAQR